jgi:queuine tRNA-ribosyltransferase
MTDNSFRFTIESQLKGSLARVGTIHTPHGAIQTPAFIVGATNATVKALTPDQVMGVGGQAVLANTYHLMLRPGADIIRSAGGIHKFMNWPGPVFTDSGGFQVFSLGMAYKKGIDLTSHSSKGDAKTAVHTSDQLAVLADDGVRFRSHLDGREIFMTPELSMELQHTIGADIHMAFDELTSPLAGEDYVALAMERTHRWAVRSLTRHKELNREHKKDNLPPQVLFGVVQGGRSENLRKSSAKFLSNLGFDGFGIGGIFEAGEIPNVLNWVNSILPENKPRHLLGMGSQPEDLFMGVEYGTDTFDCVAPTRQARNGTLYTYDGRINIKNSRFKGDFTPLDGSCSCYTSRNFRRAYIHHLFAAKEMLGATLASIHNEFFVVQTLESIRHSVLNGNFRQFKDQFLSRYHS